MRKIFLYYIAALLLLAATPSFVFAQTTLNTNAVLGAPNNGTGACTFNFENTNAYPVKITGIESFVGTAGTATCEVWIRTTPISGSSPAPITAANGWTLAASGTFNAATANVLTTFLSGADISIPAGANYGITVAAYSGTAGRMRYFGTGTTPFNHTISGGGCNVYVGSNVSYAYTGTFPSPIGGTANTPRAFDGIITFEPEIISPCTVPPTAGSAISDKANVCTGETFNLSLSGSSTGIGQTYQWQSSITGNAPWTDIGTDGPFSSFSTNQTATTYYRCAVTCSGQTTYSDSVEVTTPASVSGTFTINNAIPTGGSNFESFADAISYIGCGINGPVVFNVEPGSGPYVEQVVISEIGGASATNTVTINGNGSQLTYTSTITTERAVIKLNGADYIIIDSLEIVAGGSSTTEYGYGIQMVNDADNNIIRNCTISVTQTPATATSNAFAGIVINTETATTSIALGDSKCDNNTISGNTITGGFMGIALVANGATNVINNNKVINNVIQDFYQHGVYVNGNDNLLIEGNDISRPTRTNFGTSNFSGVYFTGVSTNCHVSKNRIHNPYGAAPTATGAAFCIYFNAASATAGNENIISNNLIYDHIGSTGNHNGILINNSSYIKVWHNTIVLNDVGATCTNCAARGIYVQNVNTVGLEFRNNIIDISQGGTSPKQCIFFEPLAATVNNYVLDGNNYYISSTAGTLNEIARVGGSSTNQTQGIGYSTITDWQIGSGQEIDSKSEDALFANPAIGDYKPQSTVIDNIGTPVGITTDITGGIRSLSSPDAGCYEFDNFSVGIDISADGLITPITTINANGCYTDAEIITVRIRNNSTSTHDFAVNPLTVTVNVTGATTASHSVIVNTGTLASGATQDVTMVTPSSTLDMTVSGLYDFTITTSVTGDVNPANNTITVQREKVGLTGGIAAASPDSYCVTGGTPTLTATDVEGYGSMKWQESATSGTGFTDISGGTTNPYTLATAITQTTYYRLVAVCGSNEAPSAEVEVVLNNPQIISTTPNYNCGAGTVDLSAMGTGSDISWYENATGGTPIAIGNNFTTPVISNTTTYYVAASDGGSTISTAKLAPDPSATATTLSTYPSIFTLTQPIILNSVQVFSGTGSAITINLYNAAGSGTALETTGSVSVTAGSSPNINLGWSIQPGTYRIVATMTGSFYRDGITTPSVVYPIALGSVGNISGYASSLTGAVTTGAAYYFLYNWEITTGCESNRVAVTATIDNSPTCGLPVTYSSFTGRKEGNTNLLEWTTATESNNLGFELQRSADGRSYSKLDFISSKADNGNSNIALSYTYNDDKPLASNNYYRLKQMDKDGRVNYSNVVLLKGEKATQVSITGVYPNPTRNTLNVSIASPSTERVSIVVTDISGKVLIQQQVVLNSGDNIHNLDVSRLSQGTYLIKTICNNGCESAVIKFAKY
ncbi:MAG: T9SS type A sorting domain-containing protein [Chitinophagaceae bacterium]|nr:T9SS type A sorting domain-containing protein [Chitinophagaceae bacterium]